MRLQRHPVPGHRPAGRAERAVLGSLTALGLLAAAMASAAATPTATAAATATAGCGDALPGAAGPARLLAQAQGWQVALVPQPAPLVVGKPFALLLQLCPPAGQPLPATLVVDADMPAHRHGMNYKATVQALGEGRFEARGLLLHMPGRWRFLVDLPPADGRPALRLSTETSVR